MQGPQHHLDSSNTQYQSETHETGQDERFIDSMQNTQSMLGSNEISNQEIDSTDKIGGGIGSGNENTSTSKKNESDISAAHILIKDSNNKTSDPALHSERGLQGNEEAKNKVINYETFESSSEDEFS